MRHLPCWAAIAFLPVALQAAEGDVDRGQAERELRQEQKKLPLPEDERPERLYYLDEPLYHPSTPSYADGPSSDFRSPLIDNSFEDAHDPIVAVNIGLKDLGINAQQHINPGVDMSGIPQDEQSRLLAHSLASLSDAAVAVEDLIPSVNGGTILVPRSVIPSIQALDNVNYADENLSIHEDGRTSWASGETVATSIDMATGNTYRNFPYRRRGVPAHTCSDGPGAFKIAIVDGGLDTGHWDFEFCGVDSETGQPIPGEKVRCTGQEFLPNQARLEGQDWYNSRRAHGCHVAGLIGASGLNGMGVTGMIPDEDCCFMFARVFDDNGRASLSKLRLAIFWAVDQGAKVINMSLGTRYDKESLREAIDYARNASTVMVASAGNAGLDRPNYPGSYDDVISVAAVEANGQRANYSNFGAANVDLAAMGTSVLSTAPRWGGTPVVSFEKEETDGGFESFEGNLMVHSRYIGRTKISGTLVDCGTGDSTCPGSGGHVCLMERSEGVSFHTMAENCILSNAIAAVVFNDEDVVLRGTLGANNLGRPHSSRIPVVGVKYSIGIELKQLEGRRFRLYNPMEKFSEQSDGSTVVTTGYERKTGTSMAAPQVSGAAAYIWRQCPDCPNNDVSECLQSTAQPAGEETYTGSGIVQTDLAFHCLVERECCAGDFTPIPTTSLPSLAPSRFPSSMPSLRPTSLPSLFPTTYPTREPSVSPSQQPSGAPSNKPSLQPSRFPSHSPSYRPSSSIFPTMKPSDSLSEAPSVLPSSQPTTICEGSCANQYSFCQFRNEQICDASRCESLCLAAVADGHLPRSSFHGCNSTWCPVDSTVCTVSLDCQNRLVECESNC